MLAKLWRALFGGCEHKWDVLRKYDVYRQDGWTGEMPSVPQRTEYHLQCERCGTLKKRTF